MARRRAADRRFRRYCAAAAVLAVAALVALLVTIVGNGWSAFYRHELLLDVHFDPDVLDPEGTREPDALAGANYAALWRAPLRALFPEATGRSARRDLYRLVSGGASYELQEMVTRHPELIGRVRRVWLPLASDADLLLKGRLSRALPESERPLDDRQLTWLDRLREQGRIRVAFNGRFFTGGDSRLPEMAGILAALVGSLLTMLVTIAIAFPLAVATAVYLEEFAPRKRWWIDLIEININNLAAVPSIVFGLLGLAVFLNFFGLPRSAPLAGGLVLALMTLPTIVIAARAAIMSVPASIREAALGLGATRMQVIQHHVLPAAMPGILTGTIIGMARALGESAPLLMLGMVAFIADVPKTPLDPATVLPVQIFLWADSPERGFVEKTSAAILVLLAFLLAMNGLAIYLRRRWEHRA